MATSDTVLDATLIEVAPLAEPVIRPTSRGWLVPAATCIVGVAVIVIAGWVVTDWGGGQRGVLALAGCVVLWKGLQRSGVLLFGPGFKLGLWAGLAWLALVAFCAIFAGWLPIEDWKKADLSREGISMRPGLRWPEMLGRTETGYSELSHVIYGARTSLMIGALAVAVGLAIGVVVGLLAGWFGRAVDGGVTVFTNSILAFPPLILLLSVVAIYGQSKLTISLGLAVVSIPTYTRLMRAQTMSVRQREFVLAARSIGAKDGRIMLREILPNAVLPVASYSFLVVAVVIVAEASLSYLGVGIPPPTPTWGGMIVRGQGKLKTDPHLVFVPAAIMFLTVLSLNRVGEHVRRRVFSKGAR